MGIGVQANLTKPQKCLYMSLHLMREPPAHRTEHQLARHARRHRRRHRKHKRDGQT